MLPAWHDERSGAEALETREGHVVGDRERRRQSFLLAILAQKAHALLPPLVGFRRAGVGAKPDASAADLLETEERPQEPRAAGAEQTRDSDDLAAVKSERRAGWTEFRQIENGLAARSR